MLCAPIPHSNIAQQKESIGSAFSSLQTSPCALNQWCSLQITLSSILPILKLTCQSLISFPGSQDFGNQDWPTISLSILRSLVTWQDQHQQVIRSNTSEVHLYLVGRCKHKLSFKNHNTCTGILFNMLIGGVAGTIIKGLKALDFLWPPLQSRTLCSLKDKIVFVEPMVTYCKRIFSVLLY